ncbi:MAG: PKD domain-containing protein [Bacteroidetes bacterium]|nr:PKD domain-containing protein [Bacteroidota bacterium]
MKNNPIVALIGAMMFFCLSVARGQTPVISGDVNVCQKTSHTYTITPTPGFTYTWTSGSLGTVLTSSSGSATIYWGLAGTDNVKVVMHNASGAPIDSGILSVTVYPTPKPLITTDTRVACQHLGDTVFDNRVPPPDFDDTGCIKVCAYSCVVYHAWGAAGSTFTWSASGSTSITPLDPNGDSARICWGGAGSASITVNETTVNGCQGTKTICIDVIDAPIAHIIALPDTNMRVLNVCDSTEIVFLDGSMAPAGSPIVSWRWDFGDGTYSNAVGGFLTPITHQYTTIGGMPTSYWAKLTVTNACGCSTTDSILIKVDPNVRMKIECPRVVCQNEVANYSVASTCPGAWSVIGGTIVSATPTTVQIKWDSPGPDGFGYVMFDASGCGLPCAFSVAKVPIVMSIGTIVGPTIVCPNSQYIYRLPQWPTTKFNWSISTGTGATLGTTDQPNEIVLNTSVGGPVTITCIYTNTLLGCGGKATININVLDPEAINGPDKACFGSTVTYNTLYGHPGNWILTKPSAATQTATSTSSFPAYFDEVGIYKLEVSGTSFCPPSPLYIKVDSLPAPPDTIIGPKYFCKGVEMKFIAGNDLPGTLYNWGMLNGTVNAGSGKQSFIKMNLSSSGPFVIYSWRTSKEMPYCPSDTITDTVHPLIVNLAVTGPDSVCPSSYHGYNATYATGETYEWTLSNPLMASVASGDGTPTPTILFNKVSGTVWLRCKMRRCFDIYQDSMLIHIGQFPPPFFVTLPATICDSTQFTATLNTGGTSVLWNFGDGRPSFTDVGSVNYTYDIYNTVNVYKTVKAIIYNPYTCPGKDSVIDSILVKPISRYGISPWGSYGRISFCNTFSQLLTATYVSGPAASSFQWYFNGSPITGATSSTYTASAFGYYTVQITSSNGCPAMTDTLFILNVCPCNLMIPASTGITSAVNGSCQTYTFNSTHSSTGYIPGTFTWSEIVGFSSYSLGGTEFSMTNSFDYGNHTIRYCATFDDMVGDTCTVCHDTTVLIPYKPDLKEDYNCSSSGGGRGVTLTAGPGIAGTNYAFFIDVPVTGTPTQTGASQTYSGFLTPGSHTVNVIQSLSPYANCTTTVVINVPALPVAAFSFYRPTATCAQEASVQFTNMSVPAGMFSDWDFGDVSGNNQYNPYRVYGAAGLYNVRLTVTDDYGCSASTMKRVRIVPDSTKGRTALSTNHACEGSIITLNYQPNLGTRLPVPPYYDWYNDNTLIAHTTYRPINLFESGYYWVHVYDDTYGCVESTLGDTLVVVQVPDAVITGDSDQCENVGYTLNGYAGSDPNITYSWTVDGSPTAITTPNYTDIYSSPSTHTYQVTVSVPDGLGGYCTKTSAIFNVIVHGTPAPPTPSFNIVNCTTYEVQLSATASGPGTFNWNTGQSGTPVSVYAGGKYQVTFTDQYGCVSRNTLWVPKDPKEYLWIFPTGCWEICPKKTYLITGPIWSFVQWKYLKNGLPVWAGGGIPIDYPNLNIDAPGTFNLYLDNGWCNATSGDMYVSTTGCNPQGKEGTTSLSHDGDQTIVSSGPLRLLIAPNPANNSTRIDYTWTGEGKNRCLEVYDITGRLMQRRDAQSAKGSWQLSLDDFAPGVYQVVMKQDGKAVLNSKLSIVK